MSQTFALSVNEQGIAIVTMDVPGESMNTLKAEFAGEVHSILNEIKADPAIVGVVICSGKADSFVAGADINMLDNCQTIDEVNALTQEGHNVFAEMEALAIPVVAAIHGPALGGGLELAMACHKRVCSDSPKTVLGLPEVQLGLLPGGGGTQRLPKLVGIQASLDMMLTGKQVRAKQALKMGLVDDMVPQSILMQTAINLALKGKKATKPKALSTINWLLEKTPMGRNLVFSLATKKVKAKTQGNYPAPEKIIDCIRTGVERGTARGTAVEMAHFAELVMSPESEQLRNLFLVSTEMKKHFGADATPQPVHKVGVLGGGLMGGGIAYVSAMKAKLPTRIKDIRHEGITQALRYSYDILNARVKRRIMSKTDMQKQMARVTGGVDYRGFHDADLVIEAVFEDLSLKQQMVADIEENCRENTIFASNTSSLPIHKIAEKAKRPENVIGLHYFSPVDKMPLVEVIAHEKTSAQTIATTVAFARKQGKTPIVVKDGAGFYVNRILALYMNEAANVLLEGEAIENIDAALTKFGFPVGPITLLDEVGIDVGAKIGPILQELGNRFVAPAAFEKLLADDRKGKKNKHGFYDYRTAKKGKKKVDETVYPLLGITPGATMPHSEIADRCVVQMLNEAVRCLEEGIIASPQDGDIGAIFGIGFPPFLGGPFRYIDKMGVATLVEKLHKYQTLFGDRFAPSERLLSMAKKGDVFHQK